VKQLIAFLLDHAMLDFSGDLSIDMIKDFLRDDDSREGRALLATSHTLEISTTGPEGTVPVIPTQGAGVPEDNK